MYSRRTFHTEQSALRVLSGILQVVPVKFERFGAYEPFRNRLNYEDLSEVSAILMGSVRRDPKLPQPSGDVFLSSGKRDDSTFYVEWSRGRPNPFSSSYLSLRINDITSADQIASVRSCFSDLVELFDCWYANVHLGFELEHKNRLTYYEWHPTVPDRRIESVCYLNGSLHHLGIPGVYWGNYFGPYYVDEIGKSSFKDLPVHSISYLESGGIEFFISEHPDGWKDEIALDREARIKACLGSEYFTNVSGVRTALDEQGPIPFDADPMSVVAPAKIPAFPFDDEYELAREGHPYDLSQADSE